MIAAIALMGTAFANPIQLGGYVRMMTRPDLQGGSGKLGHWNLYGRLLNESPYGLLDLHYDLVEKSGDKSPWAVLHFRTEGPLFGPESIANWNISQVHVTSGNLTGSGHTWKIGSLEEYFGDLSLYDMRPGQIFNDTVGASLRIDTADSTFIVGAGDSGLNIRRGNYNAIPTAGFSLRFRPMKAMEVGLAGQFRYEPGVKGNQNAPYTIPDIVYEDIIRGEVYENWRKENIGSALEFPDPLLTDARSGELIGYFGFGGLGPIVWNNTYVNMSLAHPLGPLTEDTEMGPLTIHRTDFTDERYRLFVGNEIQLKINGWNDATWAALYSKSWDNDNVISPSDDARTMASSVLRLQSYVGQYIHVIAETSIAYEYSDNGNRFREHYDSIFQNTGGIPDDRGFESGDTDLRITWQGKGGLVLNPSGKGIFSRPSIRFLYGIQHSNENNAFGNAFVESINQYNEFGNVEQHWHHILSMETEAWF